MNIIADHKVLNANVAERVRALNLGLEADPAGFQMAQCKHCQHRIVRRFAIEGKHGEWRHTQNAASICPDQDPSEVIMRAEPTVSFGD